MIERHIITIFLGICLSLGFFSFVSSYLPAKVSSQQPKPIALEAESVSLSEVVDVSPEQWVEAQGAIAAIPAQSEPGKISKEDLNNAAHYLLAPYRPLSGIDPKKYPKHFQPAPALVPMVDFWRNVYANYDLHHTILHDSEDLNLVYGVLDFEKLDKDERLFPAEKQKWRAHIEAIKKTQLKEMLLRLDRGEKPVTAGEKIVFGLFDSKRSHAKFKRASEQIRGQWGQRSRFEAGLIHSGRYLTMIEKIFAAQGVPVEIANLVFVESMFVPKARSKVGAAGPWQFMPKTARLHGLVMNQYIDERYDPLIAAQAAARMLRKDYEKIGSWPLAINAYNTGLLRMFRAVRQLGTKNISHIVQRFYDRGYQFASRNFYPEFLAALEVVKNHSEYFGELEREEPIAFEELQLTEAASLYQLAQKTATDLDVLRALNPAYAETAFASKTSLPKGYVIRIPEGLGKIYLAALKEISPGTSRTVVLDTAR